MTDLVECQKLTGSPPVRLSVLDGKQTDPDMLFGKQVRLIHKPRSRNAPLPQSE